MYCELLTYLKIAVERRASDLFLVAGLPVSLRQNGIIHHLDHNALTPEDTRTLVSQVYAMTDGRSMAQLEETGDDDFSFAVPQLSRFRVSAYQQRGSFSAVIRVIAFTLPDPKQLGIPDRVMEFATLSKGLVLVTGPAGNGKSTTLACMIDHINRNYEKHIITLEDPLEYLHRHQRSIVSQREIGIDTDSYLTGLRACLRQSPDVILLGEMRDFETIQVAVTAAETGHLVLSTLHTMGAANAIGRIIDAFPTSQQHQIIVQLSMTLQAVVTQQLVPNCAGEMTPAFELLTVTPAVRNMIRENKLPQIDGLLYSSAGPDMLSLDSSLLSMYHAGAITRETALAYATNPDMLRRRL
jgi:twitching motility protein PilT